MSKKRSLPDSLELLLDTMCNTFGGIIFIAITLIIVSQLAAKSMREMSPEELDRRNIQRMEEQSAELEKQIQELSKRLIEEQFQIPDAPEERRILLAKLAECKKQNAGLKNRLDALYYQMLKLKREVQLLNKESAELKSDLTRRKKEQQEQNQLLNAEKQRLVKEIAELEEKLKNTPQRKLRFAMEETTYMKPYWVLLKRNRVYRLGDARNPMKGEVSLQFQLGNRLRMKPLSGTFLGKGSEDELEYLFRSVDKHEFFIYLVTDHDSFSAMLLLKQHLRNTGFKVNWMVNPEYMFVTGASPGYKASF